MFRISEHPNPCVSVVKPICSLLADCRCSSVPSLGEDIALALMDFLPVQFRPCSGGPSLSDLCPGPWLEYEIVPDTS